MFFLLAPGSNGITMRYVGSVARLEGSGCRLISEYERPLRYSQVGVFHSSVAISNTLAIAIREEVAIFTRPL